MRRILASRLARSLVVTLAVAAVLVGLVLARYLPSGPRHTILRAAQSAAKSVTKSAPRDLPSAPVCAPENGPVSTSVSITMSTANDSFSNSCYYAPANQSFTIQFDNPIRALGDDSPVSLTLLISPSQDPAVTPVSGNPDMSELSTANASFVGTPVAASTGQFSVPALSAGTYDLQVEELSINVIATLVVQ